MLLFYRVDMLYDAIADWGWNYALPMGIPVLDVPVRKKVTEKLQPKYLPVFNKVSYIARSVFNRHFVCKANAKFVAVFQQALENNPIRFPVVFLGFPLTPRPKPKRFGFCMHMKKTSF